MKKRLLFVYPTMMIGGSTTALLSLLNCIEYDQYDVDLLLFKNEGPLMKYIPEQVTILPQACKSDSRIVRTLEMLCSGHMFRAVIDSLRYKKKWGLMTQDLTYARLANCRKLDTVYDAAIGGLELWANAYVNEVVKAKTKISWIHTDYERSGYIPRLEEKSLQKSDHIICVSDILTTQFKLLMPSVADKVMTLENILSKKLVKRLSMEEIPDKSVFDVAGLRILTVARLDVKSKRLDRAIKVLAELKREKRDVTWFVVGDGPDREMLENMAKEEDVEDRFILLGARANPYPYYRCCDLFALVSDFEGKPVSVTEALMMGVPVVATRYDTVATQVCDGVNGLIAERMTQSVKSAIESLICDPEKLKRLRENAQKIAPPENMTSYRKFTGIL